ncbi:Peptidase dimerization domain family protein [Candida albicans]|uniref:Peptidase dimerization domain family protein n=1 Tax=Candida albicans TaxID=5476 RepID=A0A8H6F226_CANAX|nr:Peptidase dimerization domain family protein [Candida albicans]
MIGLPLDENFRSNKRKSIIIGSVVFVALLVTLFSTNLFNYLKIVTTPIPKESSLCPLYEPIAPESYYKDNSTVLEILHDKKYKKESIKRLAGAIQVDTQVFDKQPAVDDAPQVWAKFAKFHDYLEQTFPLVYKNLKVTKVNTYGLVYHWKGSDKSLKPVLLTAHQDTVPVQKDTLKDWTIHHLKVITMVNTFTEEVSPIVKISILAAFGFDEETSGYHGAAHIGKYLEETFGQDSVYALIDEGAGLTVQELTNTIVALPGTAEKGYVDIQVELTTPGGHSSIPPDHTSIGIISELGYIIEKDPYIEGISKNRLTKYLIRTSQALDIINGGEKANALPEHVKLLVNHRVAIGTSVAEVQEHFVSRVVEVAKRHGLSVSAFGKDVLKVKNDSGLFNVTNFAGFLNAAPVTPTNDTVWEYLSGVTRHVYEDLVFPEINILNIFRFTPAFIGDFIGETHIHSVDEKLPFDSHLQLQAWFYEYIQAIDSAKANNK